MAVRDPLFFISEPTTNVSASIKETNPVTFHPFNIFLNLFLVLILIYISILVLKVIMKGKTKQNSHLLKETIINNNLKILYIKIGKILYLVVDNNNQLTVLDKISNEKEILKILTEQEDQKNNDTKKNIFSIFKKTQREKPEFENTLNTLIKNTNTLEDLNK